MIPTALASLTAFAIILGFGLFLYWLIMLVDCAQHTFEPAVDKLFWLVILLLVPVIGPIMYHMIVRAKRTSSRKHPGPEKWVV